MRRLAVLLMTAVLVLASEAIAQDENFGVVAHKGAANTASRFTPVQPPGTGDHFDADLELTGDPLRIVPYPQPIGAQLLLVAYAGGTITTVSVNTLEIINSAVLTGWTGPL